MWAWHVLVALCLSGLEPVRQDCHAACIINEQHRLKVQKHTANVKVCCTHEADIIKGCQVLADATASILAEGRSAAVSVTMISNLGRFVRLRK